jgi:hypothetical protein
MNIKKAVSFFGLIAFALVIMFVMASCETPSTNSPKFMAVNISTIGVLFSDFYGVLK